MYSIEYYKNKKKPLEVDYYRQDMIEKCWNIKSLTIDIEDIKYIIFDHKLRFSLSLFTRVKRNLNDDIDSITILNNNVNLRYIYEIINCDWMVNKDQEIDEIDVINIMRSFAIRIKEYDTTDNQSIKRNIEILLRYYMDTIMNKYKVEQKSNDKTIKLGNRFIR